MLKKLLCTVFLLAAILSGTARAAETQEGAEILDTTAFRYEMGEIVTNNTGVPLEFIKFLRGRMLREILGKDAYKDTNSEKLLIINVEINKYNLRSGFMDSIKGMLGGRDSVASVVRLFSPRSGQEIYSFNVETTSTKIIGGVEDMAMLHAEQIVSFLLKK